MTALAAAHLGYRCHIFCPEPNSPGDAGLGRSPRSPPTTTSAALDALRRRGRCRHLRIRERARRDGRAARDAQAGASAARHPRKSARTGSRKRISCALIGVRDDALIARVGDAAELAAAIAEIGLRAILKTARLGYDGKGQVTHRAGRATPPRSGRAHGRRRSAFSKRFVDFACEISVIVARGADGAIALLSPGREPARQSHSRRPRSRRPPIDATLAARADAIARDIAEALDLVGVLAVEMFVAKNGARAGQRAGAAAA